MTVETVLPGVPVTFTVALDVECTSCVFVVRDLNAKTETKYAGSGYGDSWSLDVTFSPGRYAVRANGIIDGAIVAAVDNTQINVTTSGVVDYEAVST